MQFSYLIKHFKNVIRTTVDNMYLLNKTVLFMDLPPDKVHAYQICRRGAIYPTEKYKEPLQPSCLWTTVLRDMKNTVSFSELFAKRG